MADRKCKECKHYKLNIRDCSGLPIYGCQKWNCEFEPKDNKDTKKDGGQNE